MFNEQPIFVNGVARGGTNILMNFLLSHPSVAMPTGELQKVINGGALGESLVDRLRKSALYRAPLSTILGPRFFDTRSVSRRRKIPLVAQRKIDRMLYVEKVHAIKHEGHNMYCAPNERYSKEQLESARLVCKNISGLIFLTEHLQTMYRDAKFVCIIRDGLALLEGHIRRGRSPEEFAIFYRAFVEEVFRLKKDKEKFLLVRYEDLIQDPMRVLDTVYRFVKLEIEDLDHIRFQLKSTVQTDGSSLDLGKNDRSLRWYPLSRIQDHLTPNVNQNQILKLDDDHKEIFLRENMTFLKELGYSTE